LLAGFAQAAEPRLQDATIKGSGGTITISRLPVRTSHGTIYRDVTIELSVDEDGRVHFATGAPTTPGKPSPALVQAPSLPPRPQHFRPGTYEGSDGALMHLTVTTQPDGPPAWHLSTLRAGSGTIEAASWQEGAIAENSHADIIRRAGITSQDYSYGLSEGGSGAFGDGALLGAAQNGPTLVIVGFRHGCCTNMPVPAARRGFTFVGR
jgi:hypothetical protein